ncbi:MAG: hypothetical protein GC129_00410 [Proteobacteria bacterium]|nr:hypothetical protein [Pseudomonadota bacterium]
MKTVTKIIAAAAVMVGASVALAAPANADSLHVSLNLGAPVAYVSPAPRPVVYQTVAYRVVPAPTHVVYRQVAYRGPRHDWRREAWEHHDNHGPRRVAYGYR